MKKNKLTTPYLYKKNQLLNIKINVTLFVLRIVFNGVEIASLMACNE